MDSSTDNFRSQNLIRAILASRSSSPGVAREVEEAAEDAAAMSHEEKNRAIVQEIIR